MNFFSLVHSFLYRKFGTFVWASLIDWTVIEMYRRCGGSFNLVLRILLKYAKVTPSHFHSNFYILMHFECKSFLVLTSLSDTTHKHPPVGKPYTTRNPINCTSSITTRTVAIHDFCFYFFKNVLHFKTANCILFDVHW